MNARLPPLDPMIVREINDLWEPVYPHLIDDLSKRSGIREGRVLDLGPFSGGLALHLLWAQEDLLVSVTDDSETNLRWVEERAAGGGDVSRLTTRCLPSEPLLEHDRSFDVVVVRGAFFFLTPALLEEVFRVLRPGGFGWVGGGFGASTPPSVIAPIAERSRDLNLRLGKQRVAEQQLRTVAVAAGLAGHTRVSSDGGLWIEMRR